MRIISLLQVMVFLAAAAYLVLVALENPLLLRLPIPGGEWFIPSGLAVALAVLVGILYAALLLLPLLWREQWRLYEAGKERRTLEQTLAATLGARLGAIPDEKKSIEDDNEAPTLVKN